MDGTDNARVTCDGGEQLNRIHEGRRALVFVVAAIGVLVPTLALAAGQAQTGPLSNDDVTRMVKSGLKESIVLSSILDAPSTAFDTTAQGLVALKTAGISNKLVDAIQTRSQKDPTPTVARTILTNDDVITMTAGRLSSDIILKAIHDARSARFDVSPDGLIQLHTGRVDNAVIEAIQKRVTAPAGPSTAPPATGAHTTPQAGTSAPSSNAVSKPAPAAASKGDVLKAAPDTGNWRKDLQAQLTAKYNKAELNFLSTAIKKPGKTVLLMQSGVLADKDAFEENTITPAGVLKNAGVLSDAVRLATDGNGALDNRVALALYQPVFVTDIIVNPTNVTLRTITLAAYVTKSVDHAAIMRFVDGTSRVGDSLTKTDVSLRKSLLIFRFENLNRMSSNEVADVLDKVILPYDDPRAPQFGTVSLGLTRAQVIQNLGAPKNVIKLGDKEILVYDKIKVTLVRDKVTDVN